MNSKSLIQILLLLLLIVVGAGAYLYQQNGGFGFITDFLGDKPAAPPTPVKVGPAAAPAAKSDIAAPTIPTHPAKGQVRGVPFFVGASEIENGVLTLRQREVPDADTEVTITLMTKMWDVPAGRTFKIINQQPAADAPLVRIRWKEEGQGAPRQQQFTDKFTLLLELGQERDKKLPGKIYLSLPDEDKSVVAGTFEAGIRGFRLINGKPDLSSDSVDTLQFLALRELLRNDPTHPIADIGFRDARYDDTAESGLPQTGYLAVEYQVGEQPVIQKFQFVKESDTWRVIGMLKPDQLDEAHPYKVPTSKERPQRVFPYLAARRVEAETKKRHPNKLINSAEFTPRHSDKHKVGVCEVSYKVGDGELVQTAYLFWMNQNGWALQRELGKKEKVNLTNGKVEVQR